MGSRPPIINLANVELTLASAAGPVHILRGIDLVIATGETVGIIGPSGSGKSTLMAVMSGLERASSGTVLINGQDITGMSETELALLRRAQIGIVMQSFHLIPTMTALENVAVPLELAGDPDPFNKARAGLSQVGLAHRHEHYPAQLSGGEQQRVALARALAPQPAILFADEPTGNLDTKTGEAVIDLMFQLHDVYNASLVLITHDISLAKRCDRIIHMADGRIIGEDRQNNSKTRKEATAS